MASPAPVKANKYREQGGYKSQDKHGLVFFYPLFPYELSSFSLLFDGTRSRRARPFYIPRMNY